MIKALNILSIEGTFLDIIKATYDKLTANTVLNGFFLLRLETRQGRPFLPLLFNTNPSNQARQRNKRKENNFLCLQII